MEIKKEMPLTGIVTAKKCPSCGHHEVGVTTQDGAFHPLSPGTRIQVLEDHPAQEPRSFELEPALQESPQASDHEAEYSPWVPGPVKGDRPLRLKYGVMVREGLNTDQMIGEMFEAAYMEKLRGLIEREIYTPVAVILDQFFVAPHLASGDSGEIAFNMWQELEEIREPVELVKAWLDDPNEEHLVNLIRPKTGEDMANEPVSDEEMKEELEQLTLEEFLE
ncbi:MAG: hypothetical protein JRD02_12120, partial [Deltaproteobacteria bacterium]|nr:hypothetical protein [Deltaproteobacteria bacterium]